MKSTQEGEVHDDVAVDTPTHPILSYSTPNLHANPTLTLSLLSYSTPNLHANPTLTLSLHKARSISNSQRSSFGYVSEVVCWCCIAFTRPRPSSTLATSCPWRKPSLGANDRRICSATLVWPTTSTGRVALYDILIFII